MQVATDDVNGFH